MGRAERPAARARLSSERRRRSGGLAACRRNRRSHRRRRNLRSRTGWAEFDVPGGADEKGKDVYASIRNVHRQAYIDLAFLGRCRWNGYKSVESKLRIAATALQGGAQAQAQALVDEARATYKEQLAAQRKVAYLVGVTLGIGLLAGLQLALHGAIGSLNGVITEDFALQMVLFAGMGTLASVLTRIGQFRVEVYATRPLVLIIGGVAAAGRRLRRIWDLRVPSQRPRDGDGEREQRVGREQRDVHLPLGGVPVRVLRAIRKHVIDQAASALGGGGGSSD